MCCKYNGFFGRDTDRHCRLERKNNLFALFPHFCDKNVSVELGRGRLTREEIRDLGAGSAVQVDKKIGGAVDVFVHGELFAHGEVGTVEGRLGVRITDHAPGQGE